MCAAIKVVLSGWLWVCFSHCVVKKVLPENNQLKEGWEASIILSNYILIRSDLNPDCQIQTYSDSGGLASNIDDVFISVTNCIQL